MNNDIHFDLYSFVNDNLWADENRVPDMHLCIDYCESQDIEVTDEVLDMITDLIEEAEKNITHIDIGAIV